MNFTIENKKNKIVLSLQLPKTYRNPKTLKTENRIIVSDVTAVNYLKDNNIKFGSMIKSGKNDNLNPPYFSQWEFELYEDKPLKKQENINFSLDKSSTHVVSSTKKKRVKKPSNSNDVE